MQQHRVRRLPVVDDNGTLCGIITTGDIRGADVLAANGIAIDMIATARTTPAREKNLARWCVLPPFTQP